MTVAGGILVIVILYYIIACEFKETSGIAVSDNLQVSVVIDIVKRRAVFNLLGPTKDLRVQNLCGQLIFQHHRLWQLQVMHLHPSPGPTIGSVAYLVNLTQF